MNFNKSEFADAIVANLGEELSAASTWEELDEIAKHRPVLRHIVGRIIRPVVGVGRLRERPYAREPRCATGDERRSRVTGDAADPFQEREIAIGIT